jgi:hypothetical protein
MFGDWDRKVTQLKFKAVEKGYMTGDWQVLMKVEEDPKAPEATAPVAIETSPSTEMTQKTESIIEAPAEETAPSPMITEVPIESNFVDLPRLVNVEEPIEKAKTKKTSLTKEDVSQGLKILRGKLNSLIRRGVKTKT